MILYNAKAGAGILKGLTVIATHPPKILGIIKLEINNDFIENKDGILKSIAISNSKHIL